MALSLTLVSCASKDVDLIAMTRELKDITSSRNLRFRVQALYAANNFLNKAQMRKRTDREKITYRSISKDERKKTDSSRSKILAEARKDFSSSRRSFSEDMKSLSEKSLSQGKDSTAAAYAALWRIGLGGPTADVSETLEKNNTSLLKHLTSFTLKYVPILHVKRAGSAPYFDLGIFANAAKIVAGQPDVFRRLVKLNGGKIFELNIGVPSSGSKPSITVFDFNNKEKPEDLKTKLLKKLASIKTTGMICKKNSIENSKKSSSQL